jgi:hypothetical protein
VGWVCGGVKVLPFLGGFSYKVYLQHAFCVLPLITILESPFSISLMLPRKMYYTFVGGIVFSTQGFALGKQVL